ncbi:MAG: 3-deoxy-7-phosphoheptulonate synthase [Calditrichia bacterium]
MRIILQNGLPSSEIEKIVKELTEKGVAVERLSNANPVIFKISENGFSLDQKQFEKMPGVQRVLAGNAPFHLVSREYQPEDSRIKIGDQEIGGPEPVIIAGPCAVESEEQVMEIARFLSAQGLKIMRGGAFKPRTSPYSFSGLGEEGLKILARAREETGIRIVTEVLDTRDVELVARYADALQIGSRNMQNYQLLKAVGQCHKPVLLKRGMSAQLKELLMSAEYIVAEGNRQVILCERGIRTFNDYTRNTLDLNIVPALREMSHLPILVDPSHGTGRRSLVEPMSLAALAAGANGLLIEIHPNPDAAWSDAEQTLSLEQFARLHQKVKHLVRWQLENEQTLSAHS